MLHCVACPPHVGDTLFADQYQALAAMPSELRNLLRGLQWHLPNVPHSEVPDGKGLAYPMVRTHPVTGREFLFFSPSACQIRGLTRRDSEGLLRAVHGYQTREQVIYRHSWRSHDVVVWENCSLLHKRADLVDFATCGLRAMHRSATAGDFAAVECEPAEV